MMKTSRESEKGEMKSSPGLHSLQVSICGESVSLRSDQPAEVVEKVAAYLNGKIREAGGHVHTDKFRVLAMAAMGVAGEMFELQAKLEETDKAKHDMLVQAKSLTESLDRALAPVG
jgi:cell division protein ZapA (FtsZ GTPase activity inhibitor)